MIAVVCFTRFFILVPRFRKRAIFNNPILATLAGAFLNIYGELVLRTSRVRIQVDSTTQSLVCQQGFPVIYALWHRDVFFMPLLRSFEGRSLGVLLSQHRDAQIVGVAAQLRGVELIKGSSTRGGYKAYLQLLAMLRNGKSICLTPDGPKGPPCQVKKGIIQLAMQTRSPIVPVALGSSKYKNLRSWDRSVLPLPFARHILLLGSPLIFSEMQAYSECQSKLMKTLNDLGEQASRVAGY